jgi:methyl-accepting chemotaxis protein
MKKLLTLFGLRTRITIALVWASAGTAVFLIVGVLWIINGIIDRADQRELRGHYDALLSVLQQEARQATAMSAVVALMPPVQQAVAHGDRAALMTFFGAGFAELKSVYGVEQFQFHTPPATSFLRVHDPVKFGDNLSSFRKTVVEANAVDKPVFGLEGGVAGLGIRGVVPIDLAGKHLGTVEFGLSFGQGFFDQFKQSRHIDIAFHLRDKDTFKTFGGTLDGHSFFGAADYRAATSGDFLFRNDKLGTTPVSALLGPIRDFSGQPIGAVELVMDNADYATSITRAHELTGSITVVGLLVATLLGYLLARGIARPILNVTDAMRQLAAGNHEIVLPERQSDDEVGRMVRAVEVFRINAIERVRLEAEQQIEHQRAEADKRAALQGMVELVERETSQAVEQIGHRTEALAATAAGMRASANRTDTSAKGAASAAAEALANAQTVASAAEQLAGSIREIGGQVGQSSQVVRRAVAAGAETRATIEALNQEVERIGAVAGMISEIAARTNLLALNATIEAARAGDSGKGFAVVASEVKQLATQTAHSTKEIGRHIARVRAATGASVVAVVRIEQTITEINAIANSIAAAVEQQGAATAEIARNVTGTATAANEVTSRITEVSAEAVETDNHAIRVGDNAAGLATAVDVLKHAIIRVVRTATPDANRRRSPRHPVDLPCQLGLPGQGTQTARVRDISEHGACIRGGPLLSMGDRGTLHISGFGFPVPFTVRSCLDDELHVAFTLDAAAATRLAEVVHLEFSA